MRTAIYCRVSTPGQKNTTSLPEQERINREHAAALGWEVSEPHVYREVEGGEDLYLPQMDRLWDAIQRHEIDAVVIDVLDRLSRDEGDQGAVYHHADRYGVTIELASQDFDETEQGRTLRFIAGLHARMEHADIRRRTQRGRKARVAAGKILPSSFPLYGYLWGDPEKGARTHYVEDPETAWVVRRIYQDVADGVSLHEVSRRLEAEGILTPGRVIAGRGQLPARRTVSGVWSRGMLQRILNHPAYWGAYCAYRYQHTAEKVRPIETGITTKVRRTRVRAEDDQARVALPATACPVLISPELAERVHARLAQNKAESPRHNPDPLATLWRGRSFCGHCDGRMSTRKRSSVKTRLYVCSGDRLGSDGNTLHCPAHGQAIVSGFLDPAGWADVRAWLSNPDNVARLLSDWQERSQNTEQSLSSRLDAAAATVATLRDKMGRLAETIAETSERESRRTLQEKLDAYAEQVRKEEEKHEQLLREAREAFDKAAWTRDMSAWVRAAATKAASATREEQQRMLKMLGAEVTIWRKDYIHPDGWPQRYQIKLRFTGFTGQAPVTLPVAHCDTTNLKVGLEQARALKEQDPAVRAGRFEVKVLPWMVPAGAMSFSPTRFPRSLAEAEGD